MPDERPRPIKPPVSEPKLALSPAEDGSDFIAQAEKLVREGRAEDAIAALDTEMVAARDQPGAWRAKARVLRQLGDIGKAREVLDTALKQFGKESGLLMDTAELHFLEGDFDGAAKIFEQLTEIEPNNSEGWLGKGRSLLYGGDASQALACAEQVLRVDARSTLGHTLRGDSLVRLGGWEEAFAAFAKAADHPDQFDSSSWAARGDQFRQGAQPELALRAYERAIEQDSTNPEGWHGKGTVLKARGDIEGALTAFQRASGEDRAFIAGFLDAGALCVERGELDRGLELFERARDARPNDPRPWIAIGGLQEKRALYDEARAAYEHATDIDPRDAETWNSLGSSLYNLDRLDAAVQSYQRAIDVKPDYGWPHHNLAYVLVKLRRFDDAVQSIDRAVEIDPKNATFWRTKLGILSLAERIGEIDATAERALETAGDDVNLRIMVASIFADADRTDRARNILRGVQPSAVQDEVARLNLAEDLLVIGDTIPAVTLLHSIDLSQLKRSHRLVWSFLHLVADRLAGAARLSEELLVNLLREFEKRVDEFKAMDRQWTWLSLDWTFVTLRNFLRRSELPMLDKLVLAILVDLLDGKIHPADFSFFSEMSPKAPVA